MLVSLIRLESSDFLFILDNPTLLGVAAIIAAIGGIFSTIMGARKARREQQVEDEELCIQRLRDTRAEAEKLAEELYEIKMGRFKTDEK